jgi:hypothetical protein
MHSARDHRARKAVRPSTVCARSLAGDGMCCALTGRCIGGPARASGRAQPASDRVLLRAALPPRWPTNARICRNEGVVVARIYALACMSIMAAAIVNLAWSSASGSPPNSESALVCSGRGPVGGTLRPADSAFPGRRLGRRRPVPAAPRRSRRRGTPWPCCVPGAAAIGRSLPLPAPAAGPPAPYPGHRDSERCP